MHGKGNAFKNKDIVNNNYGKFEIMEDIRKGSTEKYPSSIISIKKSHPSVCLHPTEKPVALLEYLIRTYTNENETILDNCMGSGSTGVACINTKRNFIGIEIDKNYFDIAQSRINDIIDKKEEKI